MRNIGYFAFSAIMLFGCNATQTPELHVSGLAFYNASNFAIENISLKVVKTGKMVSCSLVEEKNYCGTGFPMAKYKGAELSLRWQSGEVTHRRDKVMLKLPNEFDSSKRYVAVFKIDSNNQIDAFFALNPRPF